MRNLLILLTLFMSFTGMAQNKETPYRPSYHFTPDSMWMNDPNGMVYFEGEYHLFYQYHPYSTIWGPMHWGHAVSKDMIEWEHLPIALYPDSIGMIFSGSCVIDWNNDAGLQKGDKPTMIAFFTYHNMNGEKEGKKDFQTQGMAYSHDNGRTWIKYEHNPIIYNPGFKDFRDPKVMYDQQSKKWIMSLAVNDHISFYSSKNLLDWKFESNFGKKEGQHPGMWECPDLFPMKADNGETKWVLIVSINPHGPNGGSATQYFTGHFDGHQFISDDPKQTKWLDYGRDNYAGVTWSGLKNDRRVLMGWMSNWQYARETPTKSWRSSMTLPRELSLKHTDKGYFLRGEAIKELDIYKKTEKKKLKYKNDIEELSFFEMELSPKNNLIVFTFSNSKSEEVKITYNDIKGELVLDRTSSGNVDFSKTFSSKMKAPIQLIDGNLKLKIYIDNCSIEIIANDGDLQLTSQVFPTEKYNKLIINSGKLISSKVSKIMI